MPDSVASVARSRANDPAPEQSIQNGETRTQRRSEPADFGRSPRRTSTLVRDHDISGVSGTGVVAEGVVWSTIDDAVAVHGLDGATRVVWDEGDGCGNE